MTELSIIVPIFNAEQYLDRCIQSLIKQTLKDIQILLIDDGSTDSSSVIAKQYAATDNRIQYFYKENGGVSSARNLGLQKACGEWITFVDSDDWVERNYCEIMLSCAKERNLDIVEIRRINEFENASVKQPILQEDYLKEYTFNKFIPNEENFYGTCWGYLFARHCIEKITFDENIHLAEDALFTVEAMSHANKIGVLNEFLYHYNLTLHSSLSQGVFNEKKYTVIQSRIKQLELFRNCEGEYVMSARLADACFYMYTIGHNTPGFMKNHYKELNKIFKMNFKNWNSWSSKNALKRFIRLRYRIDLNFGYQLSHFFVMKGKKHECSNFDNHGRG